MTLVLLFSGRAPTVRGAAYLDAATALQAGARTVARGAANLGNAASVTAGGRTVSVADVDLIIISTLNLAASSEAPVRQGAVNLGGACALAAAAGRGVRLGVAVLASTSSITGTATPPPATAIVPRPYAGTVARPIGGNA